MRQFLLSVGLVVLLGCHQNQDSSSTYSSDSPATKKKLSQNSTDDGNSSYISNWELVTLFNTEGSESTAYLKRSGTVQYVFPLSWDRYDNTSGDPTDGEAYITVPPGDVSTVFVDILALSRSKQPVAAVRIVWTDGTQTLYIYELTKENQPLELFSLASKGQINVRNSGIDDVLIQNDEALAEGIRRTQYEYDGRKFISVSPVILDKKVVLGFTSEALTLVEKDQIKRLKGPWVFRENLPESIFTPTDLHKDRVIVNFMPESKQIIFSRNDMAEVFSWRSSTRLLSGLLVSLQNSFVQQIVQSAIIQFVGSEKIIIRFQGDMIWTGIYERMTRQERNYSIEQQNMVLQPNSIELAGSYRSSDGREFFFSYPNFTMRNMQEGSDEETGTYALLRVNKQDILETRTVDQNGRVKHRYIYEFNNSERTEGGRLIRSFVIIPGSLYIYGVITDGSKPITFEQVSLNAER